MSSTSSVDSASSMRIAQVAAPIKVAGPLKAATPLIARRGRDARLTTAGSRLHLTAQTALVLYIAVIASRATSLLFSKILLTQMSPLTLMGLRFLLAFALLAMIFHGRLSALIRAGHPGLRTLAHGTLLGLAFFCTMACELTALRSTASSTVSFLENTAIVIVPLATALFARKLPSRGVLASLILTMAGVGLITLCGASDGSSSGSGAAGFPVSLNLNPADSLALLAAVFYSAAIMLTGRFSREDDPTTLGILQIGTIGVLGAVAAFIFEEPVLPATPASWGCLAVLVIVCTGFGFTLQPVAQRHIRTNQAGMLCATNPLVAGTLGILVLGEPYSAVTLAGMGLVIVGMLLSARS